MLESLPSSHKIFPASPALHCKPESGDFGPIPADSQDVAELELRVPLNLSLSVHWPKPLMVFVGRFSLTDGLPVNYESVSVVRACLSSSRFGERSRPKQLPWIVT